jgi:PAS domain S-box-containing protein
VSDSLQVLGGSIALLLLITLACLIIAYRGFENAFVKPLKTISQKAEQLVAGKYPVRTGLGERNDEIGRLSQNFDKLALSLEEQKVSLENESNANQASQEKYFRLFEDSILGIIKISPDGKLLDANPALVRMLGYSTLEELLKNTKNSRDLFQYNPSQNATIHELISNHQPVHAEVNYITKEGKAFPGNLFMWGVWNKRGDLEAIEGFVEDTSLARQTQTQLIKLGKAVEQNPIGIIISDGNGSIEYANPAVENVYGLQPAEIIGAPVKILLPKDIPSNFLGDMTWDIKNGKSQQGEIKNTRKNGEEFWVAYNVSPIVNDMGENKNSLILIEDITQRHLNQERSTALRTIDLAISSNMDLAAILNIIIHLAEKHLGVAAVHIQKFDTQFHMLHTLAQLGMPLNYPTDIPFPASADMNEREIIQDFSIYIPENLSKQPINHQIPFPRNESLKACFGLPLVAKSKILGLIRVYTNREMQPEQYWMDFFYNLAAQISLALENDELINSLHQSRKDVLEAYDATIAGWSKALEFRDEPTEKHSENTTGWTMAIAREMGFTEEELEHVWRGAKLHDIGKFNVPDRILKKKGPLDSKERKLINEHPVAAYNMLKDIQFLKPALDIPYCHHERWDGLGYPRGLKGEEIPLVARIFSVADVFDAMIQDRPYREALPLEVVINHLREESGKQFDPEVVETFLSLLNKQNGVFIQSSKIID